MLNRREKRNAVSGAMLEALPRALMDVNRAEVRAVILYGEGEVFSAGIDFKSLTGVVGSGRRT
jgi:enoyl-CoA hydratase